MAPEPNAFCRIHENMTTIGTVESLWRYPVKSMRGEQLPEVFMGFSGIYGDRYYAFKDGGARKGSPYLTASTQERMLLYQPRFRHPKRSATPPNWIEAASIAPGLSATNGDVEDMALDVVTPSGEVMAIDDPALLELIADGMKHSNQLQLVRSDRPLVDCRPVSLIGLQSIRSIASAFPFPIDKRRFRANIYLNLDSDSGISSEADLVGRRLRIGSKAAVMVLERDPRCKVISLDPETSAHNPEVLRHVAQADETYAGVYCAILIEGLLQRGDSIQVLTD